MKMLAKGDVNGKTVLIYRAVSGPTGQLTQTCRNFNAKGCTKGSTCARAHSCMRCGTYGHAAGACPVPEADMERFWPTAEERLGHA